MTGHVPGTDEIPGLVQSDLSGDFVSARVSQEESMSDEPRVIKLVCESCGEQVARDTSKGIRVGSLCPECGKGTLVPVTV